MSVLVSPWQFLKASGQPHRSNMLAEIGTISTENAETFHGHSILSGRLEDAYRVVSRPPTLAPKRQAFIEPPISRRLLPNCYILRIQCIKPSLAMHIYRIDHDRSRTHSWVVTVQRRGRVYSRHFMDTVYGGKRTALDAAKMYRDNLVACLRPLTRQEHCRIRKKNNRSGVSGVTRIDVSEHSRGRSYRKCYWLAQWPIGGGKAKTRKCSIKRYGERGAFQRALQARREALKNLPKTV